jgi:hypothetical protein
MNKDAHSMTSNQRISEQEENRDENTIIQMIEAMDIAEQEPHASPQDWTKQQVIVLLFTLCFLK